MAAIEVAALSDDQRLIAYFGSIGFMKNSKILYHSSRGPCFWSVAEEDDLLEFPQWRDVRGSVAISPNCQQIAVPQRNVIRLIDGQPVDDMTESSADIDSSVSCLYPIRDFGFFQRQLKIAGIWFDEPKVLRLRKRKLSY